MFFLLLSEIDKQQVYHEKKVDGQQFHRYHKTNESSPLTQCGKPLLANSPNASVK